jgi:hypothetical protein
MLINARYILIVVLSLWLPVQSLAGVLVHCERLADSAAAISAGLESTDLHNDDTSNSPESAANADCHGAPALPTNSVADKQDSSDRPDCFHCDGSCHGAKTFSMISTQPKIGLSATDSFINLHQAATDGYAVSPQRPPCTFSHA